MLEPAPYALEYLLSWLADVTVNGQVMKNQPVFPLIRKMLAHPEEFGITPHDAQQARALFLEQAGQALEEEGGRREWLEKELGG